MVKSELVRQMQYKKLKNDLYLYFIFLGPLYWYYRYLNLSLQKKVYKKIYLKKLLKKLYKSSFKCTFHYIKKFPFNFFLTTLEFHDNVEGG